MLSGGPHEWFHYFQLWTAFFPWKWCISRSLMLGIIRRFRPSHPSIFGRQSNFTRQSKYGKRGGRDNLFLYVSRWIDKRDLHVTHVSYFGDLCFPYPLEFFRVKMEEKLDGPGNYGNSIWRWNIICQSSDILSKLKTVVGIRFRCEIQFKLSVPFYHRYIRLLGN